MSKNLTVAAVLESAETKLTASGIATPQVDSELLLGAVLAKSRGEIQAAKVLGTTLTVEQHTTFMELLAKRETREPLQHILGAAPFYGQEFAVGKGVFVPRPETEQLLEYALNYTMQHAGADPQIIDFCSGSGAIAIAAAQKLPESRVIAVEKDSAAYTYLARNNATNHSRVELLQLDIADLAAALGLQALTGETVSACAQNISMAALERFQMLQSKVQLVVSNPPYVPSAAVPADPEVRDFDPSAALYSGADGLALIRWLIPLSAYLLAPAGLVAIEHTEEQGTAVRELFTAAGLKSPRTHPDLSGRDRFSTAVKP